MTFSELKSNTFWIDYRTYTDDILAEADSVSIVLKNSIGAVISTFTTASEEVEIIETGWYRVKINSSSLTVKERYLIQFSCILDTNTFTRIDYIEVI